MAGGGRGEGPDHGPRLHRPPWRDGELQADQRDRPRLAVPGAAYLEHAGDLQGQERRPRSGDRHLHRRPLPGAVRVRAKSTPTIWKSSRRAIDGMGATRMMALAQETEHRRASRTAVDQPGILVFDGDIALPCAMRDVSDGGARIHLDAPMPL